MKKRPRDLRLASRIERKSGQTVTLENFRSPGCFIHLDGQMRLKKASYRSFTVAAQK